MVHTILIRHWRRLTLHTKSDGRSRRFCIVVSFLYPTSAFSVTSLSVATGGGLKIMACNANAKSIIYSWRQQTSKGAVSGCYHNAGDVSGQYFYTNTDVGGNQVLASTAAETSITSTTTDYLNIAYATDGQSSFVFVGRSGGVTRLQVGYSATNQVTGGARVLGVYNRQQLFVTNDATVSRYSASSIQLQVTITLDSFCSNNGVLTAVTDGKSTITIGKTGNVCVNDYSSGAAITTVSLSSWASDCSSVYDATADTNGVYVICTTNAYRFPFSQFQLPQSSVVVATTTVAPPPPPAATGTGSKTDGAGSAVTITNGTGGSNEAVTMTSGVVATVTNGNNGPASTVSRNGGISATVSASLPFSSAPGSATPTPTNDGGGGLGGKVPGSAFVKVSASLSVTLAAALVMLLF